MQVENPPTDEQQEQMHLDDPPTANQQESTEMEDPDDDRGETITFDVVITDWRLPGMGGLDIIRHLHRERPRLPLILITAHGSTDTAIEATKHGAFEYLVKPLDMEELLAVTARAVPSVGAVTGIWRGRACSALGKESVSMPCSKVAVAASVRRPPGSVTVRVKRPRRTSRT